MGPAYLDSYAPLVILTVAITFDLWQAPSVDLLYAIAKHRAYACLNSVEGVLNLGLSLWLVRRYGMMGVALGTLGAMSLMRLLVQPVWVCRLSDLRLELYLKTAGSALGKALVAAAIAWVACSWAIRPAYSSLAGSVVAAVCVYSTAVLFLVFDGPERQRLWSALAPLARIFRAQPLPAITNTAPTAH
jgi:O-antigen/teichoic acid export membrane protein